MITLKTVSFDTRSDRVMVKRNCPVCGKSQANLSTHLSRIHKLDGLARKEWLEREKEQRQGLSKQPVLNLTGKNTQTGYGLENENCDSFKMVHPFTAIIAGMTSSGKTVWVQKLLENASELIKPTPRRIIWCYSQWQPAYEQMKMTIPGIDFSKVYLETLKRTGA